jgi:hypothetical protein
MASPLTIQPENTSCHLYEAIPATNYSEVYLLCQSTTNKNSRPLLRFDFSALPAGATISNATLSLLDYTRNGDPTGRTYDTCRVTQTGWVATQATWNLYGTGATWVVAGGDFTETSKASATVPSAGNWIDFDVTTLAQWFQANASNIAIFIVKDQNEDSGAGDLGCYYRSNWYGTTAERPKLVITYSTGTAYTLTADVGNYILTGIDTNFTKTLKLMTGVSEYVLTGVETTLSKALKMICGVGEYILTVIDAILTKVDAYHLWTNQDKSGDITASNVTKSNITPTNINKNNITAVNTSKNNITPANSAKSSTSWTNQDKS